MTLYAVPRNPTREEVNDLIKASRFLLKDDPPAACCRARLALALAAGHPEAVRCRALANLARAELHGGDQKAAARLIAETEPLVEHCAGIDRAQVLEDRARVLSALGRLDAALAAVEEAIAARREAGVDASEPISLVPAIFGQNQLLERAVRESYRALDRVDVTAKPHLGLVIFINLALFKLRLGHLEEAASHLETADNVFGDVVGRHDRCRMSWARGAVSLARGDVEAARRALTAARDGFEALGLGRRAAEVSAALESAAQGGGALPPRRSATQRPSGHQPVAPGACYLPLD